MNPPIANRTLNFLLIALLMASVGAPASAAQRRKKTPKPATTQEQTLTAESEAIPAPPIPREKKQAADPGTPVISKPSPEPHGNPNEGQLTRASGRKFDLRNLPHTPPVPRDRNELEPPPPTPVFIGNPVLDSGAAKSALSLHPAANAPMPPPNAVYEGLDRFNWGAGSPPDTNGDVGPTHYIQTVNTSIGVFRKSDGFMEAAFTYDTFMSQGNFGNLCDTNNFGDPVVVYDTFEDRWIITDFAFKTDVSGNVVAPAYQCFAASMNGDPIAGGWNFYSIQISDNLNDYPKFGIWPDGLYMSANLFSFGAGSTFRGARVWAFNKAQMYAGSPTVKVVSFDVGGNDFTLIPSNARLQAGTPPAGRPNLYVSTWLFLNAVTVYKFHVDWNDISLSTFTGPDVPTASTSWPNASVANVPQSGTSQLLDALQIRAMVQNQYTNFSGTESLWVPHTVRRQNTTGFAAPRWYQVNVTGGTVAATLPQATTWDPNGANVLHRWMPSLALDRTGNMAMGYSTSSSSTFPSMAYAGRLAADPVNTFSLTEQTFFTGTASQLSSTRWGDYSSMTLDPDGCTFWYANEYATGLDNTTIDPTSFNKRWKTKFGSFGPLPGCTPVGAGGTVSGTVTRLSDASPIAGATVALGARSTTTDGSGVYSFAGIPAGTYPSITASFAGYVSSSASNIVVTDGGTTTQNFALATAPPSACLTDTTQADFQTGVPTNVDLNASPGDVVLTNPSPVDQQNTTVSSSGAAFSNTAWYGQTFTSGVTGKATRVDVDLFCFSCTGTPPNLVVSIRNTSGNLPTGADLASGTAAFTTSGSGGFYSVTMTSPPTLTAGTQYAIVVRMAAAYSTGTPAFLVSSTANPYAGGRLVNSTDSGGTWGVGTVSGVNLTNRDGGFKVFMNTGFTPSGTFVSGPKDSNPAGGITPIWQTFSWNTTTPANTSIRFQLAGSNSVNGPFSFVGPDGTSSTFFTTSPVQLSPQFYNKRYLEYEAILGTTDGTVTPALNDATVCFNDVDCSTTPTTIVPTPPQVCANSTGNTASGPGGMTSYAWGIANGTITTATNTQSITYTAGASGTVTLTLTVTAPNGCIVSSSQPVTINALPPKPTISGTLAFCTGGSTTLTSSAPGGNQWFLNNSPIGGATNQTYVVSAAGSYSVQVTDPNGCVSPMSDAAAVAQNSPPPTPTISADTNGTGTQDQACPEQPLTLHANGATGATSYQWYNNTDLINGATSQTYQATGAANYYVTATNANGCTSAQSAAYPVQNPTPHSAFLTADGTMICSGGSVHLSSDSATGIQWYRDGVAISGANSKDYVATAAGTYTVILDALGCHSTVSNSITLPASANPAPNATITAPATVLVGSSNNAASVADAGAGATYSWSAFGGSITSGAGTRSITFRFNTVSGTHTLSANVTTADGCTDYKSVNVNVVATMTATHFSVSAPATVTNGAPFSVVVTALDATNSPVTNYAGTIHFTSSSAGALPGDYTFLGSTDNGSQSFNVTLTTNGAQSISVSDGTISGSTSVTVVCPALSVTASNNGPACTSVTITANTANGGVTFAWTGPNGFTSSQPSVSVTTSGTYTVTLSYNGCTSAPSSTSVTILDPVPPTPTITATTNGTGTQDQACPEQPLTLTANGATGATSYQWYQDNALINGATSQTYQAVAAGTYHVTAGDSCGTSAVSAGYVVFNPTPHSAFLTAHGTMICSGGSVLLSSDSATGIQWYKDGVAISGANSQDYVATAAGTYTVILDALGCHSSVSNSITLPASANPAPNATITAPVTVLVGSSNNAASVADAGAGATYSWSAIGGSITSGAGTRSITFRFNTVSGTHTLSVNVTTADGCTDYKSVNVNVVATMTATHFSVSAPATVTNGTPFSVVVTALDSTNSPVTNYAGTVHFTSSSAGALPGDYTFLGSTDNGSHSFNATLTTSGAQTLSVSDGTISGSTGITVVCPALSVTASNNGPACGSVTITANTANGGVTFAWTGPNGFTSSQPSVSVTTSGTYTVTISYNGCTSEPSSTSVTVHPIPSAAITAPSSVVSGSTGNPASVANAGAGATYNWSITNGTITAGTGTNSITFTAGAAGTLTLQCTVTTSAGCSDTKSANVTVSVSVTSVVPPAGSKNGGIPVTVNGSGFKSGATVTFGGAAATNVVVVNPTKITAKTPAHAPGTVDVKVTNTDTTSATLVNGYTYVPMQFDPNGDGVVDPSDIFYLVHYLFTNGPAPIGAAGMESGDANGDGVVDPSDIFYTINYLYMNGPAPFSTPGGISSTAIAARLQGSIVLGKPVERDGRWFVPVIVSAAPGSDVPQALSLRLRFDGAVSDAVIHRAGAGRDAAPAFEISRRTGDTLSYLVSFDPRSGGLVLGVDRSAVVAEIELTAPDAPAIAFDPSVTMLGDAAGIRKATVENGMLTLHGTSGRPAHRNNGE